VSAAGQTSTGLDRDPERAIDTIDPGELSKMLEKPAMLVQPHRDNRELYTEFLRYHDFAVAAFADAEQALRCAPLADVIVTDIRGTVDGAQMIARLRSDARTKDTPVIVVTAAVLSHERARMEAAGCDCFLPMPCLPDDLLRQVRFLVMRRRKERRRASHRRGTAHHRGGDDARVA
jgi:CheY-like chemotaxis protein